MEEKDHHIDFILKIFEWASHLKKGGYIVIKCPNCKHPMMICRSSYNGHVNAMCGKCHMGVIQ